MMAALKFRRRFKEEQSMANPDWQRTFRDRMKGFGRRRPPALGEIALSVKIRVTSGCFHREHSPRAYDLIDSSLAGSTADLQFEEHESGPELLVYLAAATAGLTLAKSVIDLITAIIKARSEGVKKGDQPDAPLELIIRRIDDHTGFREETVLRIGHAEPADPDLIKNQVAESLKKLLKTSDAPERKRSSPKAVKRKNK
jgi:hypothetical protein